MFIVQLQNNAVKRPQDKESLKIAVGYLELFIKRVLWIALNRSELFRAIHNFFGFMDRSKSL